MSVISKAARHSFERLFCAALQSNIGVQAGDDIAVRPASGPEEKAEHRRTMVLLTCASLRFKLVAVFQIVDEALARTYYGGSDGSADHIEALSERGNLCCGAMNRDLQLHVPHMGLSTPSVLSGLASRVLDTLQAEHVSHFAIHVNGQHLLDASLCMRGKAEVDFVAQTPVAAAETGELELL